MYVKYVKYLHVLDVIVCNPIPYLYVRYPNEGGVMYTNKPDTFKGVSAKRFMRRTTDPPTAVPFSVLYLHSLVLKCLYQDVLCQYLVRFR